MLNSRYTELITLCFQHKWIASLGAVSAVLCTPPCTRLKKEKEKKREKFYIYLDVTHTHTHTHTHPPTHPPTHTHTHTPTHPHTHTPTHPHTHTPTHPHTHTPTHPHTHTPPAGAGSTLKGKRKKKADTRRADGQKQRRGGEGEQTDLRNQPTRRNGPNQSSAHT